MPKILAFLMATVPLAAQLPEMRIEPAGEGSVIYLRNTAKQPLTAWLIELVGYPGSSFALWQDELANPAPPGAERKITVGSKMVGAVPEYVKVQAALYADGSTAGVSEKIATLTRRRAIKLETMRELIRRMEFAPTKPALIPQLKEWNASVRDIASRTAIDDALARLESQSVNEVLAELRALSAK